MISRQWTGWLRPEEANNYERYLAEHLLPELSLIEGFTGITIYKRPLNDAVEFLVVTNWMSMNSIKQFAGDNPSVAIISEKARNMMVRYDEEVRHYETITL